MYKIKKIIREGILETNSSSSHSVCICMDGSLSNPGDKTWDLDIRDGILYIPEPIMVFGRSEFKSNRCLLKIQYAYGLAFQIRPVEQYRVTEVLKKVTGVQEVSIAWVNEYKRKMVETHEDYSKIYVDTPEIDHQSTDLFYSIFENDEVLKEFIFNPKSWLYGGSDEIEWTSDFRKECILPDKDLEAKLVVHLGSYIGDVEIVIDDFVNYSIFGDDLNKLQGLFWDIEKDEIIYENYTSDEIRGRKRFFTFDSKEDDIRVSDPILCVNNNNELCVLIFNKMHKSQSEILNSLRGTYQLSVDSIKKSCPNIVFKEFPAELVSNKFGKVL